jgi:hypothetical protein
MNSLDFTRPITHREAEYTYESPAYCVTTSDVTTGTSVDDGSSSVIFS